MIEIDMHTQPTDKTCTLTSLHDIYQYYGHMIALLEVINKVGRSVSGGTLASMPEKNTLSSKLIAVANPQYLNPTSLDNYYKVSINLTFDANIPIMYPGEN